MSSQPMSPEREWLLRFAMDHVRRSPRAVDPDRAGLLFVLRGAAKLWRELHAHRDAEWLYLRCGVAGDGGGPVLHAPVDGMVLTLMGYAPSPTGAVRAVLVTSQSRGVTYIPWARDREEHVGRHVLTRLKFERLEARNGT